MFYVGVIITNISTVYIVIGDYFEHMGLLLSLKRKNLLSSGDYFVIGVDVEQYDPRQPQKYFRGKHRMPKEVVNITNSSCRCFEEIRRRE